MKASKLYTVIAACLISQPLFSETDQEPIKALEEKMQMALT